jgi:hypothetical protein
MARLLFIVARDQPGLLEFLRKDFALEVVQGDVEISLTGGPADRDRLSRRTEPRDVIVVPQSVARCGKTKSSSTSESA